MTLGNGICDLGYENLRNYATLSKENAIGQAGIQQTIQNGNYALSNQLSDCCCKTQRAIDSVNFNAAQNTAAINENTTAQVQKVLDALCQGKIDGSIYLRQRHAPSRCRRVSDYVREDH